jgi:hypothetical protein
VSAFTVMSALATPRPSTLSCTGEAAPGTGQSAGRRPLTAPLRRTSNRWESKSETLLGSLASALIHTYLSMFQQQVLAHTSRTNPSLTPYPPTARLQAEVHARREALRVEFEHCATQLQSLRTASSTAGSCAQHGGEDELAVERTYVTLVVEHALLRHPIMGLSGEDGEQQQGAWGGGGGYPGTSHNSSGAHSPVDLSRLGGAAAALVAKLGIEGRQELQRWVSDQLNPMMQFAVSGPAPAGKAIQSASGFA